MRQKILHVIRRRARILAERIPRQDARAQALENFVSMGIEHWRDTPRRKLPRTRPRPGFGALRRTLPKTFRPYRAWLRRKWEREIEKARSGAA